MVRPDTQCRRDANGAVTMAALLVPGASMRFLSLAALACRVPAAAAAAQPATVRVDYIHGGNALSEQYAMDRVVVEPLPWPGDMTRTLDDTDRGINKVEVVDAKTGRLLYSRGF